MSILRLDSGQVFGLLQIYRDIDSRSAALNMALDEALLEAATEPTIRFYRWDHPALSFGYFGKFADVANHQNERDLVRRWTGGGIVLHGADLTYSIVIPATDPAFAQSSMSIYERTHAAIRATLATTGSRTELAGNASSKISESCFANAARADVLLNGQKIAGAAQRRTRRGLLQQGSIQNVALAPDFGEKFALHLSTSTRDEETVRSALIERAQQIANAKYAKVNWLRRR
jgi:lipoate-protein ligase A